MGNFNRSSSRFNRGGGSSSEGSGSHSGGGRSFGGGGRDRDSGGGGEREERSSRRSGGGNGGGGYRGGNGGGRGRSRDSEGGGEGDFPFTRIASITIPKSATDDARDFIEGDLKDSKLVLNAKIFLGKGDNELKLRNGDMLIIQFKNVNRDPDYVVGQLSVKN